MPIVEIEIVLRPDEILPESLAQELADRIGAALGASAGTTWVKLRGLAENQYAESGGKPLNTNPVFVTLMKSTLPTPDVMQAEVDAVGEIVSRLCGRPTENVHLMYLPEGKGRVAFGGKLIR